MINENLDRVFNDVDLNTDKAVWVRFCEWIDSFHELDTSELAKYEDFSAFERNGGASLSLKYLESIKDLWVKWSKAVESDNINASLD